MKKLSATPTAEDAAESAAEAKPSRGEGPQGEPTKPVRPKETGGRDGPEPTRFGDWEKNGRCIDF